MAESPSEVQDPAGPLFTPAGLKGALGVYPSHKLSGCMLSACGLSESGTVWVANCHTEEM